MKDIIRLNGLSFYGYHGVSASEKETGRMFEVDCEIAVDLAEAGHSDNLSDTINYEKIYSTISESVNGKAFSLLEGLAQEIVGKILDKFPIYQVTLQVRKMTPPLPGQVRAIEIEVTRQQGDTSKLTDESQE